MCGHADSEHAGRGLALSGGGRAGLPVAGRRWNGWGDAAIEHELPEHGRAALEGLVGPGNPPRDATLDEVARAAKPSRLEGAPDLTIDVVDRIRHARGQGLDDWVALRSGRLPAVPDAVARPPDAEAVRALLDRARDQGWTLVPYGGGTSVVGGVTVEPSDRPIVTVDMAATAGLRDVREGGGLATFGAGTLGPQVEAALAPQGLTLGHFPQSFEHSTIGGWVAARSAGQASMGYGRIEDLWAGGHLEAPGGSWDLPPHPASAAGPDLREVVLGSEGRLGILTDIIVRPVPRPERDVVRSYVVPDWGRALALGQALARSGLDLGMVRVSTATETTTTLAMVPGARARRLIRGYLEWRRQAGGEACLVLVGLRGRDRVVRAVEGEVGRLVRDARGIGVPRLGVVWQRERFAGPYLRNTLWSAGYAVDTVETAVDWARLPALASALTPALRGGLEDLGERVHAYAHLSHLYPSGSSLYVTYVFRQATDPDGTLERWRRLKRLASETIVAHGGTISHQHGVGRVHAPYLSTEKGALGMAALRRLVDGFDPTGILAPGVLLEDER
jgi:alkyldihydroxyacetonephosphate synthase